MAKDDEKMLKSMDELSQYIKTAQGQNKQLAAYNTILTIAIVGIVVLFLTIFYFTITQNFTQPKLTAALEEYGPQIIPKVSDTFVEIVTKVSPKYSDLFQKKAVENMPLIAATSDAELIKLSENISSRAKSRLEESMINVIEAQKKTIKEGFEGVEDAQIEEELKTMESDMEKDFMEIGSDIIENSIDEFVSLKATVDTFEDKSLPDDKLDLSVLFLHNLIQLADQEMMEKFKETRKGGK